MVSDDIKTKLASIWLGFTFVCLLNSVLYSGEKFQVSYVLLKTNGIIASLKVGTEKLTQI